MQHVSSMSLLIAASFAISSLAAQDIEVTLLGTGNPGPTLDRFGPSTLIEAGDNLLIVDVGRGAMQRLWQLGISYGDIDAIFLTHLHSDHIVGLPDLWLTGWLFSARDRPLRVFGPPGTANLVENLREAYAFDIAIRIDDDKLPLEGSILEVTEIEDGYVYEHDGIRVVTFDVDHRPVSPALGYRIEFGGRKVLLSGDTRYSENLIENAMDVDLIIHEVVGATSDFLESASAFTQNAFAHHTTAREAGDIFTKSGTRAAAYSHLILLGDYDQARLISDTRQAYDGPLFVGEDLMRFVIGDEVEVVAP